MSMAGVLRQENTVQLPPPKDFRPPGPMGTIALLDNERMILYILMEGK